MSIKIRIQAMEKMMIKPDSPFAFVQSRAGIYLEAVSDQLEFWQLHRL